tara:strand:+ start:233 stop:406 length:174 start_codon:yes stop_codon:yes gene_type:complete
MFYWTPKKLKELKEKGYRLKYYKYNSKYKNSTIEEVENKKPLTNKSFHGKDIDNEKI